MNVFYPVLHLWLRLERAFLHTCFTRGDPFPIGKERENSFFALAPPYPSPPKNTLFSHCPTEYLLLTLHTIGNVRNSLLLTLVPPALFTRRKPRFATVACGDLCPFFARLLEVTFPPTQSQHRTFGSTCVYTRPGAVSLHLKADLLSLFMPWGHLLPEFF